MSEEENVQIKNKELLRVLREERDVRDRNSTIISNGYAESRSTSNGQEQRSSDVNGNSSGKTSQRNARREEATNSVNGTAETVQSRVRQTDRSRLYPVEDVGTDDRRDEKVTFQLKNPFHFKDTTKKPIKLFTKVETELEHDRLVEIYFRGSSLLDDILEIVVKDHEPVTIWQLEQEEAEMLAEIHLQRAQVNEDAARSARQMLAMYDRLYFYLLVGPRAVATFKHVEKHQGVSFR